MARLASFVAGKLTLIIVAAVVASAGGWALFFLNRGDEPRTISVERRDFIQQVSVAGTVKASRAVDLGFAQSGRVSATYVSAGERVARGAVIAEIENGDLRASVLQREAALESAEAKLASLEAGTRQETIAVTVSEIESDEVALAQADRALSDAIQSAYTASDSAVRNTLDEFIGSPHSSSPQLLFQVSDSQYRVAVESGRAKTGGTLAAWHNDIADSTPETAAAHVALAQATLAEVVALLGTANAALNHAIASSGVSQTSINAWIADVAAARTAVNAASSALTTAQTSRAAAAAKLDKDKKTLALQEAGSTPEDIAAQKAQVASAAADLENARAQLRKTIVAAPFAGTVTRMDANVGEVVSPGTSQISMISDGVFQIECFIPEINVALVKSGDPASVTLDAYGETPFGASVVSVDIAETVRDGVSTYRAILQFTEPDERVRSGMTANVRILTEKKDAVISIPQRIVIERDGKQYVPVREGETVVERDVTTGSISSSGEIEITSGLAEGDLVVLP